MEKDNHVDMEHKYNSNIYFLAYEATKRFLALNFKEERVNGIENIKELNDNSVLIYVSSHKSHFDYMIIPYHLRKEGIKIPAITAGDNLFIGPLGWILRRLKAIKLERGNGESLNHFLDYIKNKLVPKKEPLLIFPEYTRGKNREIKTGRSYTGTLNKFAPNFLSPLVASLEKNPEIFIIPTSVSYSRIPEDALFSKLGRIKSRNKFLFKDIPHIFMQCFARKGTYQLNFGEPIQLRKEFNLKSIFGIRKKTGRLYAVFPSSLFAHAVSKIGNNKIPYDRLEDTIKKTYSQLDRNGAIFSDDCNSFEQIMKGAVETFNSWNRNIVLFGAEGVSIKKPEIITYYSNTIEHLLS
ncbi:1-acyl-sn-glycerol-3-phosphate acyltransferase [Candidatus Woesearchaeota archaeon]|nr:1-acyl-sn-glycerol-3-phosphate acyltransferase [Candidatus Woesearchaeota archaeon]